MNTLESFGNIPLFNGLTSDEVRDIMQIASERAFKKGDVIFYEHSEGNELFILTQGAVSIQLLVVPDEEQVPVHTVKPGGILGELAIIDSGPRAATARCEEDVRTLVIRKNDLEALFEKNNHLGMVIYRNVSMIICDRIRRTNEKLVSNITWGVI